MTLSEFDRRLLEEGLAHFSRPRLATLLEMLGTTKLERLEALTTMLRLGAPEEYDEAVDLFERAVVRAGREQPKRRSSAENREERRRSS
jgi:hypothetical protein